MDPTITISEKDVQIITTVMGRARSVMQEHINVLANASKDEKNVNAEAIAASLQASQQVKQGVSSIITFLIERVQEAQFVNEKQELMKKMQEEAPAEPAPTETKKAASKKTSAKKTSAKKVG